MKQFTKTYRTKYLCVVLLFLLCALIQPAMITATDIMPISEIKEGMTGVGRTVFKGNKIEEFQVEILGVLKNYLPQQSLILAILKGSNLEETGVIAGMSGSPVFIDGKMIGAVAYSWPFAKTPIAGITPIESMLEAQVMPAEQPPIAPPIEVANYYKLEDLIKSQSKSMPKIDTSIEGFGRIELQPITTPLMISGFDQKLIDRFTSLFSSFGWHATQAGAAVGKKPDDSGVNLEPGSPVSIQLINGDFDIGAIGTVTYRDADKVLAFGHPFFNLGPIDLPMATAQIYTVVPSLFSSFKVGVSGPTVGSVKQDLHSAVFGIMGSKSPMIPITVNMRTGEKSQRSFHFDVVNHNLLSPLLLDFAFQNSILVTQLGYSESTLKLSGSIEIKDRTSVQVSNIFSGAGSFTNASQYVASILYALMTNEFNKVEIEDVVINVDSTMKRREAEILEVWLDKNEVHAGEQLKLKVLYRPLLGEKNVEEFRFIVPEDVNLSQIQFIVAGGQEISRHEFALYGKAYQPDSLTQLIGLLNSLRSNDRIYVKAFSNEPSLVLKGQFLHSLPSSVFSVLSSSQTVGSSQRVSRMGLWEDSHQTDYFLTGTKAFSVRVLPRQE